MFMQESWTPATSQFVTDCCMARNKVQSAYAANVGKSNSIQKSLTLFSDAITLLKVWNLNTGSSSSSCYWWWNKQNAGYGFEVLCIHRFYV